MPMTDKQRAAHNDWQHKNYKRLGVKLYKGDAEAFEEYCKKNGKSVNAAFKEYVAQCINRPLEKRSANKTDGKEADNEEG